jgi:hypothetical protein
MNRQPAKSTIENADHVFTSLCSAKRVSVSSVERDRAILRHILATIAYRGSKSIRDAPPAFGSFQAERTLNTPLLLVAHIADLLEWAQRWGRTGEETGYKTSEPGDWNAEVKRFYAALESFDQYLCSGATLQASVETMIQAPLADALTHIGQLSLLRRMAGDPVPGEAYRLAQVVAGRVGPEQAKPGREFERDKGALWRKPPAS